MITISRLDKAIENVLGSKVYSALLGSGASRIDMLNMAIVKAFVEERNDKDANALRRAYKALEEHGFFPSEMWDSQPCGPEGKLFKPKK